MADSTALTRTELVDQLATARNQAKLARAAKSDMRQMAWGQFWGGVGGLAGAMMKKYMPGLIPGEAGDDAAILIGALVLDTVALATGDASVNSAACGLNGYLVGTTADKILP